MWLFTSLGFFSAVMDRNDARYVIVRARCETDLETLADFMLAHRLAKPEVISTPNADYPCRVRIHRSAWQRVLGCFADTIHYDNFKVQVALRREQDRNVAYHAVWRDMMIFGRGRNRVSVVEEVNRAPV